MSFGSMITSPPCTNPVVKLRTMSILWKERKTIACNQNFHLFKEAKVDQKNTSRKVSKPFMPLTSRDSEGNARSESDERALDGCAAAPPEK